MEEEKKEFEEKEEKKEEEKVEEAEAKEEKSDFQKKLENFNNTADTTKEFDAKDIEENKAFGILAYLSILVLIPLLAAPKSKFARYHTNQGLVLFIAELIAWIPQIILSAIFGGVPVVYIIVNIIFSLIDLCFLILAILGIVNACQGKAKELPILGKFKLYSVEVPEGKEEKKEEEKQEEEKNDEE